MPPAAEEPRVKKPRVRHRLRTPLEARMWRRRMLTYAAIAISFVLLVNALIGQNGYLDTLRARRESADLSEEIKRVNEETLRMREDIQRLRTEPAALEEAAREQLRLSKPGETMVVIKDRTKQQ
jgi:cell division protein FtsB